VTVHNIGEHLALPLLAGEESTGREVTSVYCCDLLSLVMGRAPADSAWVTVMGNVNAIAVAALADVSCIVLAEGVQPDAAALEKARENHIALLTSHRPVYPTAKAIEELLV